MLFRAFASCAVLALSTAAPAHAGPDPRQAYSAGQYAEARQLWTPRAEAGDPDAQLGLALIYDLGQGVGRDPAMAYHWYWQAAQAGVPEAEFNVAVMRDAGDGAAQDTAAAAVWYARAAAHGNRRAQYNLAQLYAAGDGVPLNTDVAKAWFRAAAADLPAAAVKLAGLRRILAHPPEIALAPVRLGAPVDGESVSSLCTDRGNAVELVWTASSSSTPVRFFVQVIAIDGDAQPREAFSGYVDETATLAPVDPTPGRYAWRVYSVSDALKHYAASGWTRFDVKASERAGAPACAPR